MTALQNPFALLARLLMALLFLPAGISKIGGFAGTAGYIGSVGLPMPEVGAAIAILVEVGASILLIIGLFTRPAALVLAVFTLVASFFFHAFWSMPAEAQMMQSLMFYKNIAVVGGLLAIAAHGAGAFSLDAKRGG
ncbi:MAG: DoxX family membrane protein [Hydrogenophaga sp.]|uniref:DoxX family protein n=1 Tax=Hydrogenophaga sp. TaxID=1904254 RepID=UPI0016A1125B|nr:DoxX family protein [Hydrogenophaga sp.]NIM40735.1 DoxX family membrane protein [Hydrogenophaga sp.]NIN26210.1 DoxX family membrane protein [Hydrogenophaga sp.]NIN31075.1 DoxX family membrane protein [Hydrogenophaga sp.]NIN55118.1 DoxX family membrane protein [Hydrogenophaga sp.]NIO51161.1 DoxX family membrane protein [Hydrogenophaga sp.]